MDDLAGSCVQTAGRSYPEGPAGPGRGTKAGTAEEAEECKGSREASACQQSGTAADVGRKEIAGGGIKC